MKLHVKILIGLCLLITVLWIIGRLTNAIQFLKVVAASNEPTLKPGNHFFSSNLIKPERFDFICFRHTTEESGEEIWIFRLCGIEGDKVEIKNGVLFVNGQNADKNLNLYHTYIVDKKDFAVLEQKLQLEPWQYFQKSLDSFVLFANEKVLNENGASGKKQISQKYESNQHIEALFGEKWNNDFFGPVTVPAGKYFVLGDSRDNAQDSRYIGFVDKKDFTGRVLEVK